MRVLVELSLCTLALWQRARCRCVWREVWCLRTGRQWRARLSEQYEKRCLINYGVSNLESRSPQLAHPAHAPLWAQGQPTHTDQGPAGQKLLAGTWVGHSV